MSITRTALFEGQVSPPSLISYGLREKPNYWFPNLPAGGFGKAESGYGGVTFTARRIDNPVTNPFRALHNSLALTMEEMFGDKLDQTNKFTFLFRLRCTGSIRNQYYVLFGLRPDDNSKYFSIGAPDMPEGRDFVDCMLQWEVSQSNCVIKFTVDGKLLSQQSIGSGVTRNTEFYFLHPMMTVSDITSQEPPDNVYQVSARDFVFIADDGVGISGIQSSFASLYRYEFSSVELGSGLVNFGNFLEEEISRPMTVGRMPVFSTNPRNPGSDTSFKIKTANNLSRSIRVDGIGVQMSFSMDATNMSPLMISCNVKDNVGEIAKFSAIIDPPPLGSGSDVMHYQVPIGFVDLVKEGLKIKPNRVADVEFEFDLGQNTGVVEVHQVICYVFGNDYKSGFYDDTSLFGTLASRYTILKLVEDNGKGQFNLSLPRASLTDLTRNTEIDVIADPDGDWAGTAVLKYDRLNFEDLVDSKFVHEPALVEGVKAWSVLPQISRFLGLKVIENDIENTTFQAEELVIRASNTSRSFIPGSEIVISNHKREMDYMFNDSLLPGFRQLKDESLNTKMLVHFNDGKAGNAMSDTAGGIVTGTNTIMRAEGKWAPAACVELNGERHSSYLDMTPYEPFKQNTISGVWVECWMATISNETRLDGTFLHTPNGNQIRFGDNSKAFYSGFSSGFMWAFPINTWPTLTRNRWYHVRVVLERNYWAIYLDGKQICYVASPLIGDFFPHDRGNFRLGNVFPNGNLIGKQLRCRIDEFRVIESPSWREKTYEVPTSSYKF